MATCRFCQRSFRSPQSVKAHLKYCSRYKVFKNQESSALGSPPKGAATPAATPFIPFGPEVAQPNLSAPLVDSMKLLAESIAKLEEPPPVQQRRRKVLQSAKDHVIDHYYTASGIVTPAMRGAAKMAIERELATLPLEELPFEEVLEFAVTIRDRRYGLTFRKQAHEAERLRAEQEAQHRKELETLGAWRRADRRKATLIDQAIGQARAWCEAKQIVGWDRLSVLGDVKSRLTEFVTGDESILEAQAMVLGVLDAKFSEADATLAAGRAKADERWCDDLQGALVVGALAGLVMLALKFPEQALPILEWIERTFGLNSAAGTGPTSTKAPDPAATPASASAPPPRRRRRKVTVPPSSPEAPTWGHPVEETVHAEG